MYFRNSAENNDDAADDVAATGDAAGNVGVNNSSNAASSSSQTAVKNKNSPMPMQSLIEFTALQRNPDTEKVSVLSLVGVVGSRVVSRISRLLWLGWLLVETH